MLLLDAVKERIGADKIFVGHHLVAFAQDGSGVTAHFVDRCSSHSLAPHRGMLVGCDGIHSAVRKQLYPNEGPPVSTGRIQWRGVVEAEPFMDGRTHVTMGFSNQRAVVYPTSKRLADRGRSRINWVTVLVGQSASSEPATWDRRVSRDRFFHRFKDWNFPWIRFADLICRTGEIFEYPPGPRPVAALEFRASDAAWRCRASHASDRGPGRQSSYR